MGFRHLAGRWAKVAFRLLVLVLVNILALPAALVFLVLRVFRDYRFVELLDNRIGHLAGNTELFLRRVEMGRIPKKTYIGIASDRPANRQLMRMVERRMQVIHVPVKTRPFIQLFFRKPTLLKAFGITASILSRWNEYEEFATGTPQLSFTRAETAQGKKLLKGMGIQGKDWFVCVHARDSAYLDQALARKGHPYAYRDCDIRNYLSAMRYIAHQGGYAVRMGAVVEKPLPDLRNQRIIDYATRSRSDLGDAFLPAACKFFLANTSGIFLMSTIFNRPVAFANMVPLEDSCIHRPGDLFIPKKIWSRQKKRYLTFKEILSSGAGLYAETWQYDRAGLVCVENTPREILDLAREMNERLDGRWVATAADEKLQERFRSLFSEDRLNYSFRWRIGTTFLRENRNLLG